MRIVAETVINGRTYEVNNDINVVIWSSRLEQFREKRERFYQQKYGNPHIRIHFQIITPPLRKTYQYRKAKKQLRQNETEK